MTRTKANVAIPYDPAKETCELADRRVRCLRQLIVQDIPLSQVLRSAYLQGLNDAIEVVTTKGE